MSTRPAQKRAVRTYRKRLKGRGLIRLEVETTKGDAALIRQVAKALRGDLIQATNVRGQLHRLLLATPQSDLKALLASAPLEGVDVSRQQDTGREVDL